MLCLLKPIHWNPDGYVGPAGHIATSGYPRDNGFGHEEWNNSPRMHVSLNGLPFRALYTERVGNQGKSAPNDTLLLMYASHDGRQQLVGIAGSALYVDREGDPQLQRSIKQQVDTGDLWREAWKVPLVQRRFGTQKDFRTHWTTNGELNPNWICPERSFFWLEEPLDLDPRMITGKSKLLTMFSSFTAIPAERAAYLLDSIPIDHRNAAWRSIRESLEFASASDDIKDVEKAKQIDKTTQKALIDARLGQGRFRDELLRLHGHRCALTGCAINEVLRASHIRPWRRSNNTERLDPDNGLLLAAHADALFDRYLISFDAEGHLLLSNAVNDKELRSLGLSCAMRIDLRPTQRIYMADHRQEFEGRNRTPVVAAKEA